MSKTITRPSENAKSDDIVHELDETVPLPTLPTWSNISTDAANDESFADQATSENIERLVVLAESIDRHLGVIAEAVVALRSESAGSGKKKKRATKKRVTKKRATKKRATKKSATKKRATKERAAEESTTTRSLNQ